jgi:hypothetical protein
MVKCLAIFQHQQCVAPTSNGENPCQSALEGTIALSAVVQLIVTPPDPLKVFSFYSVSSPAKPELAPPPSAAKMALSQTFPIKFQIPPCSRLPKSMGSPALPYNPPCLRLVLSRFSAHPHVQAPSRVEPCTCHRIPRLPGVLINRWV